MATYNAEPFLREQLDSILSQDIGQNELEVVVSDDCSTDGTRDIVEGYHDPRIHFVEHTARRRFRHYNSLQCATRNFENAMQHATGDVIFLSDQDDVWYPGRIQLIANGLIGVGKRLVVSSFHWFWGERKVFDQTVARPQSLWHIISKGGVYGFSMAFTRELMQDLLPFPAIHQHDTYIAAVALRCGAQVAWDEHITAGHRCYDAQTSNSGFSEPLYIKVWYKLKMLGHVLFHSLLRKR